MHTFLYFCPNRNRNIPLTLIQRELNCVHTDPIRLLHPKGVFNTKQAIGSDNVIVSYPFSIQTTIELIIGVVWIVSLNFKADTFNLLYVYQCIMFDSDEKVRKVRYLFQ